MNVPKLRFKEFTDEWKMIKLDELYEFKNGINADRTAYGKGVPLISVTDIINNNFITYNKIRGKIDISNNILMNNSVEYGDILFQRSSETFAEIGTSNIYLDNKIATFGGFVIRGKRKNNEIPLFINYELKSPNSRKKIIIKGAGAQHYNIGQEDLRQVSIFVPSKEEQTKIANFLSLLDKKIELQTKRIEDLKLYKLSLLNHLLKKYDTKKIILKDICKIYAGGTPSTSNEKYWNGNIKWIQSGLIQNCLIKHDDIKNAITELGLNNSSTKMIKPNTTLLAMTGATCGNTAFLECEACANQSVMAFETTKVNSKFIYYLFQNNKKYILKFQAGGAQSGINKSSCENLEFDFPNIELQNKIVKILDYCEEQLSNNILKLSKLQELKKGLIQKMFV